VLDREYRSGAARRVRAAHAQTPRPNPANTRELRPRPANAAPAPALAQELGDASDGVRPPRRRHARGAARARPDDWPGRARTQPCGPQRSAKASTAARLRQTRDLHGVLGRAISTVRLVRFRPDARVLRPWQRHRRATVTQSAPRPMTQAITLDELRGALAAGRRLVRTPRTRCAKRET
jgi:hypothetical protein